MSNMELGEKMELQHDVHKDLIEHHEPEPINSLHDGAQSQEISNESQSEIFIAESPKGPLTEVFPDNDVGTETQTKKRVIRKAKKQTEIDLFDSAKIEAELNAMLELVYAKSYNTIVTRIEGILIEVDGISTLNSNEYVDGSIIDAYLKMILKRNETNLKLVAYNSSTFDCRKMQMNSSKNVNPFAFDIVFIPVLKTGKERGIDSKFNAGHWVLVVIHMATKKIEYYDSMLGKHTEITKEIERFLKQDAAVRKLKPYTDGWTIEKMVEIPQQGPSYNCGVFVCKYAEYIALGRATFDFGEPSMNSARMQMQYEMLKFGKIDTNIAKDMKSALNKFHIEKSQVQPVGKPRGKRARERVWKDWKRKPRDSGYATRSRMACVEATSKENKADSSPALTNSPCSSGFPYSGEFFPTEDAQSLVDQLSETEAANFSAANSPMSNESTLESSWSSVNDTKSNEWSDAATLVLEIFKSSLKNLQSSGLLLDSTFSFETLMLKYLGMTKEEARAATEESPEAAEVLGAARQAHVDVDVSVAAADSTAPLACVAQPPAVPIARARNARKTIDDYLAELPTYVQPNWRIVLPHRRMEFRGNQGFDNLRERNTLLQVNAVPIGEYRIGDLVWAKTKDYSHWPGMILIDPFFPKDGKGIVDLDANPIFAKTVVDEVTEYHVQFLGNEQSTEWVPASDVDTYIPYARYKEEVLKPRLEALHYAKDKAKFVKKEMVKQGDRAAWTGAQAEADLMVRLSNAERVAYTYEYVAYGTIA